MTRSLLVSTSVAVILAVFVALYIIMACAMVAVLTAFNYCISTFGCRGNPLCAGAVETVRNVFTITLAGIALAFIVSFIALIIEETIYRKRLFCLF